MKRSQLLQVRRIRDCGTFCPKKDIYITIPPPWLRIIMGDRKTSGGRAGGWLQRNSLFQTLQWLWLHAQDQASQNFSMDWCGATQKLHPELRSYQRVLEGWELVFFRWNSWEPIQWVHSTHAHTSSAMGVQGIEKGECEVRRGKRLESREEWQWICPKHVLFIHEILKQYLGKYPSLQR